MFVAGSRPLRTHEGRKGIPGCSSGRMPRTITVPPVTVVLIRPVLCRGIRGNGNRGQRRPDHRSPDPDSGAIGVFCGQHWIATDPAVTLPLPWTLKVRKRALSGNHRKSDTCQIRHARNRDPTGFIEEPRTPIDFDEQVVDRRKQMQWKRKLAGKRMAPVTSDANAAIRCAIQHLKIGRAAGKTDLARACSLKRIATQNEKLVPLHTKRIS